MTPRRRRLRGGRLHRAPVAQTISALLKLNAGDTVQFALDGITEVTFDGITVTSPSRW